MNSQGDKKNLVFKSGEGEGFALKDPNAKKIRSHIYYTNIWKEEKKINLHSGKNSKAKYQRRKI